MILVRHGSHADLGARLTGRGADLGLTPGGRREVVAAAERLSRGAVSAIYASPRRRTLETAAILAARTGVELDLAPPLDEIDFGDWTGCEFAELDGSPEWDRWNCVRSEARTPGGESMAEAQARAVAFAIGVAAAHDGQVLLVTHCDIIRALLCWQERRSLDEILSFEAGPASATPLTILAREPVSA